MALWGAPAIAAGCAQPRTETEARCASDRQPAARTTANPGSSDDMTAKQPGSIGQATMNEDGTIVLQLRAEAGDGTVGDALVTYAPGDAGYNEVLEHLGGLAPGQSKPVPPWPSE